MNKFFAVFFAFGATMCALTIVLLLFPGTSLDSLWRLNPDAHSAFNPSVKQRCGSCLSSERDAPLLQ